MQEAIQKIEIAPDVAIEMILVEGGTFMMGDERSEYEREKPAHQVKLDSFYLGKYPVTQAVWEMIKGNNPSEFTGENHPVDRVSWDDAKDFIERLNSTTKKQFRLPTEAEWEYAARGGRYSQGYIYAGSDKLKQVGWFTENSSGETHEVGLLLPNELGIYDMSGNIFEWCEDDYHRDYEHAPANGLAWIVYPYRNAGRMLRGGSFFNHAVNCRPAFRHFARWGYLLNDIGFRLVLPL